MVPKTGSSRSCSSYELNQAGQKGSGAKKTRRRFRFWPLTRWSKKKTVGGEPEHSSSDSWNNNDGGGASMDQSDSEDEEGGRRSQAEVSISSWSTCRG